MHATIQALLQASSVTGLAVALIDKESTSLMNYGNLEGIPVSDETMWPVASLTKPVFVYGVLQLIQQKVIQIDQSLQSYLQQPYMDNVEYLADITTRHAMSHTTGFPNWRDDHGLRTKFRPGSHFSYSSEGLNYLQYAVAHILDQQLDAYLQKNVFLPLSMTRSELRPESVSTLPPFLSFLADGISGNGSLSLWTTIGDYARFVIGMLDPHSSSNNCLNAHWLEAMLSPQIAVGQRSDLFWGLGWGLQKRGAEISFWHWGARGMPQTMNFVVGLPKQQRAIIIFTNHADGLYLCRDIIQSIFPMKSMPAFDWLLPAHQWRADGRYSD